MSSSRLGFQAVLLPLAEGFERLAGLDPPTDYNTNWAGSIARVERAAAVMPEAGGGGGGGGAAAWGNITGTLSDQTDLQTALNGKLVAADLAPFATSAAVAAGYQPIGAYLVAADLAGYATTAAVAAGYQPLTTVLTATTASYTTAKDTKLTGIATGATANSSDATLLARGNHTGTQLAATISDLGTAVLATATAVTGLLGTQSVAAFKTGLALNNVDNTADAAKAVLTATKLATSRTIGMTGDVTWSSGAFDGSANVTAAATVTRVNGVALSGLATGILKNTTGTGVPSIAVAADFPTLNQSTTGSAATLTTGRTIAISGKATGTATSFNGSANITIPITAVTLVAGDIPTIAQSQVTNLTTDLAAKLLAASNLSDLANAATARTNLGLGTSATVNTGTSGATVPLLNGTNTWAAFQTFSSGFTSAPFATSDSFNHGYLGATASHQIGRTGTTTLIQASGPSANFIFAGGATYTDLVTRMTLDATNGNLTVTGTLIAANIPASGGGTANFLRADGTWAAPPGGGATPTGTGFRHVTSGVEDAATIAETGTGSVVRQTNPRFTQEAWVYASDETQRIYFGANDQYYNSNVSHIFRVTHGDVMDVIATGLSLRANMNLRLTPGTAPGTPADGMLWYDSTAGKFRKREGGATSDIGTVTGFALTDGDKGDILVSSSGTVWAIESIPSAATAVTQAPGDSSTKVATTAFVAGGYQPLDADLTAIAALATTAYGRARLTLADAAALTAGIDLATTLLPGAMSAADKIKVNALISAVRYDAAGAALGPTIADFFTATLSLEASSTYEIECHAVYLKTTAGTVAYTWAFSSAPVMARSSGQQTPITGYTTTIVTGAEALLHAVQEASTTLAHAATGSLTTAVRHSGTFTVRVRTNAATTIQLRVTSSAGTVTPQPGSYMRAVKVV